MGQVLVYDTTLRDGTQAEDINFSAEEKLRVALRFDEAGFHYVEGGWPGASPRDDKFFELAKDVRFQNARLVAFGSTRRPGAAAARDKTLGALAAAGTPAVAIFGKSWDLHVEEVMGLSKAENLAMIAESCAFLSEQGKEVLYDAEHFFDGYKSDPDYALDTVRAAVESGADTVVLCDTNGGTLPHEVEKIVPRVLAALKKLAASRKAAPVPLAIHAHNDCGLAVANSIAAVGAGCSMVQGTVNGYGERCGNADLTSVIPVLQVKMGRRCLPEASLKRMRALSRYVSEAANMTPMSTRPFVGESAFAHKGGVHVSAVRKVPRAYEHMDPELVGNRRRVLVSDLSGKSNVEVKAQELGLDLGNGGDGDASRKLVKEVKSLENEGYQYDAAEGSFELLLKKRLGLFSPAFELKSFLVTIRKEKDRPCFSEATIKICVNGQERFTAAEGQGPVGALDNALRKALRRFYPDSTRDMRLVDFKVRVIDGREGTAARVKVFIESRDSENIWKTIGVSEDIIEASWQALADSFEWKLGKDKEIAESAAKTPKGKKKKAVAG